MCSRTFSVQVLSEKQHDDIFSGRKTGMDLQPTDQDAAERTGGHLALNDVIYVALAVAVILFGNMALVRAMDVALDSLVR